MVAQIAEKELFGKETFKRSITNKMMNDTLATGILNTKGNYSYAFEYLISSSRNDINFATTDNFKDKRKGTVSVLAKGSINTVFVSIFGYEYTPH